MIISFANQKGGVAKTTSTANIAFALASLNLKVLMIDLDPQASLTISVGLEPEELENTMTDVMLSFGGKPKLPIKNVILEIEENLHLAPAVIDLAAADKLLVNEMNREGILKRALKDVQGFYDFILIDCPPQLSQLTINALVASDKLIIPCATEYLAYRGLELLNETIQDIQEIFNEELSVYGVVATLHKGRTRHAQEILAKLEEEYRVLGVVPASIKAVDTIYHGKPLVATDKRSPISITYNEIAKTMKNDLIGGKANE